MSGAINFERAVLRSLMPQPAPEPDPMLDFVAAHSKACDDLSSAPDEQRQDDNFVNAFVDERIIPLHDAILADEISVMTQQGAVAALKLAEDQSREGNWKVSVALVRAVRVFLEGTEAPHIEADVEPSDPLLSLVTEYRTQLDSFNASPDSLSQAEDTALEAKTWGPSYAVLMGGNVPNATTLPGALTALRELHREFVDCGGADEMAIAMLPAVVAFFDAETAQAMRDRAAAVAGS